MHQNPAFRETPDSTALQFARDRSFGLLTLNGPQGPLAAHVPFLLSDGRARADLHLMRSNPIARAISEPHQALLAVSGPDGYVSPDWYGLEDQVPTWNYVAVHLRGRLEALAPSLLRDLLDRQSGVFEARLTPKPKWMPSKMSPEALARMMRMIMPARLHVESVESTFKLGQNKPAGARRSAAEALETGFGQNLTALANLMRE